MTYPTRNKLSSRLLCGSAVVSLAVASMAGPALAQPASSAETVTVTGTIIRGAAPTGSELITVGRTQIEDIGAVTIQNVLSTVPGLNNFQGAGQGAVNSSDGSGSQSPTIHSLGNSASNGTLILVDGHRLPYTGVAHSTIDPSSIPVIALQQVQVLPDGASSTYGSDAVAGVLNFITRKNYTGVEFDTQYGFADRYSNFNVGGLFGHGWDGGSALVALDYSSKSQLANDARDFNTARQDLRKGVLTGTSEFPGLVTAPPTGFNATTPAAGHGTNDPNFGVTNPYPSLGTNFDNFTCPIATIKSASNGTTSYIYPYAAGTGIANNLTGVPNGVCNNVRFGTDLPSDTRNTVFFSLKQNINSRLSFNMDFDYSFRMDNSIGNYGTVSGAVFGPGSKVGTPLTFTTTGAVATSATTGGQINPFYTAGGTGFGTTSEFIQYDLADLLAGRGFAPPSTKTFDETAYATFGLVYDLGGDWEAVLGGTGGTDFSGSRTVNGTSGPAAQLALNGSQSGNGTPTTSLNTSALPDANGLGTVTAQSRSLTTLNALDVWDPVASNFTQNTVLKQITSGYSLSTGQQAIQDVTLKFDGPAFDLPAGPVKTAIGMEYTHNTMVAEFANQSSALGANALAATFNRGYGRTVWAAYAEVLAPLVSPEMGIPLVEKFDLDISGRYDRYTFYGETKNPKVGFTWGLFDGLAARGSMGTSFTVPAFNSSGKNGDGITSQLNASSTGTVPVPTTAIGNNIVLFNAPNYNAGAGVAGTWIASAAGCTSEGGTLVDNTGATATTATATACKVQSNNQGLSIGGGGGDPNSNIQPEKGRTYSVGLDFDAGALFGLDGFGGQVTYYQATYRGLITNINITTSNLGFTHFSPPGGWTPTSPEIVTALGLEPLNSTLPPVIWWYTFGGQNNAYNLWVNGLDYSLHYAFDTDFGHFTTALSGNEILRFTQNNIGATSLFTDLNGDAGGQGRFPAQQTTFRFTLNWAQDAWRVGMGFNFQSAFMTSNTNFPYNNAAGSLHAPKNFQHVGPLATLDFNAGYTLPAGMLPYMDGASINLSINNVLDQAPPFVDTSAGFSTGSEIGRLVNLSLKKSW